MITKQQLLEYSKGQKVLGSNYLQRIGTTGNYIYIYPIDKIQKMGRRYKQIYIRFIKKHRKFLKKISLRYEATNVDIKPKNWYTSIVSMNTKNGGTLQLKMSLNNYKIKSYRSVNMGSGGISTQLAKSKKMGILRYR